MRRFLLTLDTADVLWLDYSNYFTKKSSPKVPKVKKIYTFEQKNMHLSKPYIVMSNGRLGLWHAYFLIECVDFCWHWMRLKFYAKLIQINPFPPSVPVWHRLAKLSIFILEGIIKKISYERRDYESVNEKSLSWAMSRKNDERKNSGGKGLRRKNKQIFEGY